MLKNVTLVSGGAGLVIGNYAFQNCIALEAFTLSDSVTELSMNVFDGCRNLQGVYVDEGNEYFADDDGVLYDADKTIILFYSLGRDGNVVLPETIETIGAGVFANNMKITEIVIPASVKEIQEDAFNMCLYLTDIVFETSEDAQANLSIGDRAFAYCAAVSELNLPSYVTAIGDEAFYKAAILNKINFSEGLKEIGDKAFSDTALTAAVLPDSLTTLGASAFAGCVSLSTLELSSALEKIGDKAFFDCILLSQVTIPQGVRAIGANAFENCGAHFRKSRSPTRSRLSGRLLSSTARGWKRLCLRAEASSLSQSRGTEQLKRRVCRLHVAFVGKAAVKTYFKSANTCFTTAPSLFPSPSRRTARATP